MGRKNSPVSLTVPNFELLLLFSVLRRYTGLPDCYEPTSTMVNQTTSDPKCTKPPYTLGVREGRLVVYRLGGVT